MRTTFRDRDPHRFARLTPLALLETSTDRRTP